MTRWQEVTDCSLDGEQKDAQQSTNRSDLLSSSRDPAIQDDPYSDSPDGYGQRTRLLQGTERLADGLLLPHLSMTSRRLIQCTMNRSKAIRR